MKKIFKKLKIRDLIFFIIGGIVIGTVGITATTYVLKSSEIQYKDNKSVQQAIDELYVLAENGSNEIIPIGDVSVWGVKITIPYIGSYNKIICAYGTDENYGNVGTLSNNICVFEGTSAKQKLYYKIMALNNDGKIYETSGIISTGECSNLDDNGNCMSGKTYVTGDPIKLGGYNWHVISDTGANLTLLMDANQLGDNSKMEHISSQYVETYSWNYSKIRAYLNGTFLTNLQSKINNEIVSTEICADPSREYTTYGGYLMSELTALGKTSSCNTKVSDKVRLISPSEYYNMSPKYTSANSNYPNIGNYIKKVSGDYVTWLYGSSIISWWTMGSSSGSSDGIYEDALIVWSDGSMGDRYIKISENVRPVITIVK